MFKRVLTLNSNLRVEKYPHLDSIYILSFEHGNQYVKTIKPDSSLYLMCILALNMFGFDY